MNPEKKLFSTSTKCFLSIKSTFHNIAALLYFRSNKCSIGETLWQKSLEICVWKSM